MKGNCFDVQFEVLKSDTNFELDNTCYEWGFRRLFCYIRCSNHILAKIKCVPDSVGKTLVQEIEYVRKHEISNPDILPVTCPVNFLCFYSRSSYLSRQQNIKETICTTETSCLYICQDGYEVSFGQNNGTVSCVNEVWENTLCLKSCKRLPLILNGRYALGNQCRDNHFTTQKSCPYVCDDGYFSNKAVINCLPSTREWENPFCRKACRNMPEKTAGVSDFAQNCLILENHNQKCNYLCEIGYSIDGTDKTKTSHFVDCLDNGQWEKPVCIPLKKTDVPNLNIDENTKKITDPFCQNLNITNAAHVSCDLDYKCDVYCPSGNIEHLNAVSAKVVCKNRKWVVLETFPATHALKEIHLEVLSCAPIKECPPLNSFVFGPINSTCEQNISVPDSTCCSLRCDGVFLGSNSAFSLIQCQKGTWDIFNFDKNEVPIKNTAFLTRLVCQPLNPSPSYCIYTPFLGLKYKKREVIGEI